MTIPRIVLLYAAVVLSVAATIPTPVHAGQRPQAAAPSGVSCDLQALAQSEAEFKRQQTLRAFKAQAASADGFRAAAADYAAKADACQFYNTAVPTVVADDINGAASIYGTPLAGDPTGDDLVIDFAAFGLWQLYDGNTSSGFAQLHPGSPESVATGDLDGNGLDDVIIDFGAFGIWIHFNNDTWAQLHPANPSRIVTGDLDGNGLDDVIIDFPGYGLWIWKNNSGFEQLHPFSANFVTVGHFDSGAAADVVIDFPGYGLWINYNNDPANWFNLHPVSSQRIAIGDFDGNGHDDIVVNFTGFGIWNFANNSTWGQVHTLGVTRLAAGNLDSDAGGRDELIMDFGPPYGIWVLLNGGAGGWANINPGVSQEFAVGDLDDNGQEDLVVDFGAGGLWVFANNSTWVQLSSANAEGLAVGDINAAQTATPTGILTGTISNASTGGPIAGARVAVGGVEATTNASGVYTIPNAPSGTRTVTTSAAGFSSRVDTAVIAAGATTTFSTSLVAQTVSGNVTIVLNWGAAPDDLDSHLTGPHTNGGRFHTYYADPNPVPYASLDVDDTDSFGPETVSVSTVSGNFVPGSYSYYVHNYSTTPEFNVSGATVSVFQGGVQLAQFPVSAAAGNPALDYWSVFNFTLAATPTGGIVITPVQQFVPTGPAIVSGEAKRK